MCTVKQFVSTPQTPNWDLGEPWPDVHPDISGSQVQKVKIGRTTNCQLMKEVMIVQDQEVEI